MQLIFNWFDKIYRYCRFKPKELKGIVYSILILAFAISFGKWGIGEEVNVAYGLVNLIGAIIIVAVTLLARLYFQKIVALGADYRAEYKPWSFGLMLALIIAFLSNGKLWFLIPGGIIVNYMKGHRLGWVRYGLNIFGIGIISLAGPIANILLAMIFRTLFEIFQIQLFHTAFILNLVWALWNILPIPPADGSRTFFGSRMVYMYGLAVVVSSSILLYSNINIIITIFASFLLAWLWWLIYYIVYERFVWNGPY